MKRTTLRSLFLGTTLAFAGSITVNAQGLIGTFAGNGLAGFSGDGGPAISAQFSSPFGVAVDAVGNVYVADKLNSRVRIISPMTNNISTYAGTTFGLLGLGGPANMARIGYPDAVFVNTAGDVVITDWYKDMAYYVDHTTGFLHGRCGNGNQGSTGDGGSCHEAKMMTPTGSCQDHAGNTYIADRGSNKIRRVDGVTEIVTSIVNGSGTFGYTGDGGLAVNARMAGPTGVFVDPASPGLGHLYIADGGNNVIRRVDLNTGIITTIAGTGMAGYSGEGIPAAMAQLSNPGNIFIGNGNILYFCDRGNHMVRKIDLETGVIHNVAGNGLMGYSGDGMISTNTRLNDPEGVWVDNSNHLYIADAGNNRIRIVYLGVGMGGPGPFIPKVLPVLASNELSVFPNPSNGQFTIMAGNDFVGAAMAVFNVIGVQVFSGTLVQGVNEINLGTQPAGVYTISVKSAAGNQQVQCITIR